MREEEFEELELIGRGSFGQIRKVRRITDGHVLARKEMSYKSMNQKEKSQLIAEFRILKSLEHPNIVQYFYHEHLQEKHQVYLYMEYCGGGDLAGLIRQCKENIEMIPENVIWRIFTQLILALYRCHYNANAAPIGDLFSPNDDELLIQQQQHHHHHRHQSSTVILHRDIKPDNIFLDNDHYSVKLGDFGLAKMLDQEQLTLANTYVGTPFYMSPEVLMDQPYTPQSDIWSLGCVIYELCCLHPPFQAKTHLLLSQKIREGAYNSIPDCYSSTLGKTIAACININPIQRPTTATLLRLDVVKLCRKQQEINQVEKTLKEYEQSLHHRQEMLIAQQMQLTKDFENYKLKLEQEVYTRLERELSTAIDQEVEKRVEILLQERLNNSSTTISSSASLSVTNSKSAIPESPADMSMTSLTFSPPRNVRGPRSIRDNIISPLRQSRHAFEDISNHQFIPSYEPETPNHHTSDYTSNWQTKVQRPSLGAAAARAKIMGVKQGIGRTANMIQQQETSPIWNEDIHGDDMPSPFLKRNYNKTL